jgi:OmpA-OmpF porin, OOP family
MKLTTALIAAAALVAGSAAADDSGFYVGAGAGWSQMSIPKSKATDAFIYAFDYVGLPLETWSAKTDESDVMWSAFAGYRIIKYVAVEAGYLDIGTASYTGDGTTLVFDADVNDFVSVPVKGNIDWRATGWQVSALGIWPINDIWEVFGRVGGFFGNVDMDLRVSSDSATGKAHASGNSNEFLYGLGVDSKFLENWTARFEWLAIPSLGSNDTGSGDWNGLQFSLLYRF